MSRETKSRALLEAKVIALAKQIQHNKNILVRPYNTFFAGLLLPIALYQILLNADLFESVREHLREGHEQDVNSRILQKIKSIRFSKGERDDTTEHLEYHNRHHRETIRQFEDGLPKWVTQWPDPGVVIWMLKTRGFSLAGPGNYQTILQNIPYKMRDLVNITDEKHLIYYAAQLIDWIYQHVKNTAMINRYHNVLATVLNSNYHLSPEDRILFPEIPDPFQVSQGAAVDPHNTTCLRYAQLIHRLIPDYLLSTDISEQRAAPYAQSRLGIEIFWFSASVALLIKILLDSLFSKRALPKNYRLLKTDDLIAENKSLSKELKTQAAAVKRNQRIDIGLTLVFALFCCWRFLFTSAWSDLAFAIVPMLSGITLKNMASYGIERYRSGQIDRQLQELVADFKDIFSTIMPHCAINIIKKDTIVLSYITIQVRSRYQNLPEKHLATVLKVVLNHFGVQISTHDATYIAVAADTRLKNISDIKDFFATVLSTSLMHFQIGRQLKPLLQAISSRLVLEPNFMDLTQPEWMITSPRLLPSLLSNLPGVRVDKEQIFIQRQAEFEPAELRQLNKLLVNPDQKEYTPVAPDQKHAKSKKNRQAARALSPAETLPQSLPATPATKSITWPVAGVNFPSHPDVKPIINAIGRFMLSNLPLSAFGGDKRAQAIYSEKSTQMARSQENAQGIKHGIYFGVDFFTSLQREYHARIKVLGEYGDDGVLLSIEQAESGEILYHTRAYATGLH